MSSDARIERARRWLNEQIDQLKALRNAKTRNTEFKQWRQATLTIVQRVWPGDSRRSARFRRIPFSPPSTQASARETREFYERGCAEALQLLNGFLEEIDTEGLPAESEAARPASLDPGVAEDDFPTLDLPGGPSPAAESKPEKRTAATDRGDEPAAASGRRNGHERRKRQKSGSPRRRLRDMLGLDALEKLGKEEAAAKEAAAVEDLEPAHGKGAVTAGATPDGAREPADEAPEMDDEGVAAADAVMAAVAADDLTDDDGTEIDPADDEDEAPAPHRAAPVGARDLEDDVDEEEDDDAPAISTADFLSASPVFRAEGKPVRRQRRETPPPAEADLAPAPLTSSTAVALAAIASEVARLGVPDGHRARIRASLISLAQRVEDGEIDWEGLRNAVNFAMEFPPVGRRLLPLLIPFLDKAA